MQDLRPYTGNFRFKISGDQSGRIVINIKDFSRQINRSIIAAKIQSTFLKRMSFKIFQDGLICERLYSTTKSIIERC